MRTSIFVFFATVIFSFNSFAQSVSVDSLPFDSNSLDSLPFESNQYDLEMAVIFDSFKVSLSGGVDDLILMDNWWRAEKIAESAAISKKPMHSLSQERYLVMGEILNTVLDSALVSINVAALKNALHITTGPDFGTVYEKLENKCLTTYNVVKKLNENPDFCSTLSDIEVSHIFHFYYHQIEKLKKTACSQELIASVLKLDAIQRNFITWFENQVEIRKELRVNPKSNVIECIILENLPASYKE